MRIVSPEEAVAGIRSRDQIYVQMAAATPSFLLEALVARAPELRDVGVVHLHSEGPGPHLQPEMAPHFRHRALFIGPNARQAVNEGRADFVPVFFSDVPALFSSGAYPLDAVFANVTPPDAHGFCSLGLSVEAMHEAIAAAKTVIVQLNPSIPRTWGESFIHVSQIDLAVEVDQPRSSTRCPGRPRRATGSAPTSPTSSRTVRRSSWGSARSRPPSPTCCTTRRTSASTPRCSLTRWWTSWRRASSTGERKARNQGKLVATFLVGTRKLYDFVNDNPMVEIRPVDYTNDTHVIRQFENMTAINSAIEVDLTGQVVADSIGYRMYSGVGGQMDFIRGAALAPGGRAIIALPSTAGATGPTSRIVPRSQPGPASSRPGPTSDGGDRVRRRAVGQALRERAKALIDIAHPDHRDRLVYEARLHHEL